MVHVWKCGRVVCVCRVSHGGGRGGGSRVWLKVLGVYLTGEGMEE